MHTKNLYENGPNPFVFFGTKNMSEAILCIRFWFAMFSTNQDRLAYAGGVQQ